MLPTILRHGRSDVKEEEMRLVKALYAMPRLV